jgi:PAS domain S-box-containing protein
MPESEVSQGTRGTVMPDEDVPNREPSRAEVDTDFRQSDLLRALIDSLPDLVFFKDTESVYLGCNKAFERFFGHPERDIVGKTDFDFVGVEQAREFQANDVAMLALESGRINEESVLSADGQILHLETLKTPLRDSKGRIRGLIGVAREIGERRRFRAELEAMNADLERRVAERTAELLAANEQLSQAMGQLVEAEKLAALGSLVAGVAHELNTPLGNARVVATTLQSRVTAFEASLAEPSGLKRSTLMAFLQYARDSADLLARSHERASLLISQFKSVAIDQTSERRRTFTLGEMFEELLAPFKPQLRAANVAIELTVEREVTLDSFPGPLEQVFANLIQNSLLHAYSDPRRSETGTIRIEARDLGDFVEVRFSDDGSGMTESVAAHAFEPFYTTKLGAGGSGLGLAIVRNIVRGVLGGEIAIDSKHRAGNAPGTSFLMRFRKVAPHREEVTQ